MRQVLVTGLPTSGNNHYDAGICGAGRPERGYSATIRIERAAGSGPAVPPSPAEVAALRADPGVAPVHPAGERP